MLMSDLPFPVLLWRMAAIATCTPQLSRQTDKWVGGDTVLPQAEKGSWRKRDG